MDLTVDLMVDLGSTPPRLWMVSYERNRWDLVEDAFDALFEWEPHEERALERWDRLSVVWWWRSRHRRS